MTMFDEARAIQGMLAMKKSTQCEIAEMMGTSQSYIANKLRLLKLPDTAKKKIIDLGLSERHARALLRIKSEKDMLAMIEKIADMRLSVSASEALIDSLIMEEAPKSIYAETAKSGVFRFEKILHDSLLGLRSLGISIDVRTSSFGNTKYITIAMEE